MPDKKRMVAVAIGVSNAQDMRYLPGALNCSKKFFEWAQALGYEATLVTDEEVPVTIDRVRAAFDAILQNAVPIHRLIVYFAGHGMIRELENGLWFLSDWKKDGLAVAYESMRRRLATFGIEQIAIFSDACRSLPKSVRDLSLEERAVIPLGSRDSEPDLDKFVAARDGQQTYSVPGSTEADDICVFSGVLLEGLWGRKQNAFSESAPNNVTSSSLGKYLKAEVPLAARKYGLTLKPSVLPAFPEGDNIYLTTGPLKTDSPPFEWPPPPGFEFPQSPLPGSAGGMGRVYVPPQRESMDPGLESKMERPKLEVSLVNRLRLQRLPPGLDTGAGFAVEGAAIVRLWTPRDVTAEPHLAPNWWKVRTSLMGHLKAPVPVLIELVNGQFGAVTAMPDFITGVVCDSRGLSAVVYRDSASNEGAQNTEDVIGELERGGLRAEAVLDLATKLRKEKHADPMLGVFAAYLYDSIGDVGSIRRMAHFYIERAQPIPYDIALLAQVHCWNNGDQIMANLPRVAARRPKSEKEAQNHWTYQGTDAGQGVVGGKWPWLRQGWAFLAEPTNAESTLIQPGLKGLRRNLLASRFTTLDAEGGKALAGLFQLVPREPPWPGNQLPADYSVMEERRAQSVRQNAG
jgi:hypothetical protein